MDANLGQTKEIKTKRRLHRHYVNPGGFISLHCTLYFNPDTSVEFNIRRTSI